MMRHPNRLLALLSILAGIILLPGFTCLPPVNQDSGFDIWCGQELCAWKVTEGEIERVPTWHRSDFGVELLGDGVTLTQLVEEDAGKGLCFQVDMLVDLGDRAELRFEVDFRDDGTAELSHPITSSRWQSVRFGAQTRTWFDSVRFSIHKSGTGRAVLARVQVDRSEDCPLDGLSDRPAGVECASSVQCLDSVCAEVLNWDLDGTTWSLTTCGSCQDASDCQESQACGLDAVPGRWLHRTCLPGGAHVLGERCISDMECATGLCCDHVCSECCSDEDCQGEKACTELDWRELGEDYEYQLLPWQCSPGERTPGALCLRHTDCASGRCLGTGELRRCVLDGRRCEQDQECPEIFDPAPCLALGVAGGVCQ